MPRSLLLASVLSVLFSIVASAQDENTSESQSSPTPPKVIEALQAPIRVPATPVLTEGTPIFLRLSEAVKVREAKPGDPVKFEVAGDLWYRDTLLAEEGTAVLGEVQRVEMPKWRSRGSRLEIAVKSLRLLNGTEVALQGQPKFKGEGPSSTVYATKGAEVAGMATYGIGAVVASPILATLYFAQKGKVQDAPAGARTVAFVADDLPLDLAILRALPANANRPAASVGHVHILRPNAGISAHFYCNGIPISGLPRNRRVDLDVPQGYYRFSVSANKPLEMFVTAGEDYYLIWNFSGFAGGKLVPYDSDMGRDAALSMKSVERKDYWNDVARCMPLPVDTTQP